jgi:hypothetical protein
VHPDDVLAVLTARPFLPFDVELPNNTSVRVTDAAAAALSPAHGRAQAHRPHLHRPAPGPRAEVTSGVP